MNGFELLGVIAVGRSRPVGYAVLWNHSHRICGWSYLGPPHCIWAFQAISSSRIMSNSGPAFRDMCEKWG